MLEALSSFALSFLVSFLRGYLSDIRASAAQREAGALQAREDGRKSEDKALAGTQAAIDEADKKPIEYRD